MPPLPRGEGDDRSYDVPADVPGNVKVLLQEQTWEFQLEIHVNELVRLRDIHQADWSSRASLRIGEVFGSPVHWCISDDGKTVAVLVGHDDETWQIAFTMPGETIDQLLAEAADFLPELEEPSLRPGRADFVLTSVHHCQDAEAWHFRCDRR